jgi:hypothetical protein
MQRRNVEDVRRICNIECSLRLDSRLFSPEHPENSRCCFCSNRFSTNVVEKLMSPERAKSHPSGS